MPAEKGVAAVMGLHRVRGVMPGVGVGCTVWCEHGRSIQVWGAQVRRECGRCRYTQAVKQASANGKGSWWRKPTQQAPKTRPPCLKPQANQGSSQHVGRVAT